MNTIAAPRRPFCPRSAPTRRIAITTIRCSASPGADRTADLRRLLDRPGILLGPAAYDGISAKLTEAAGFDFGFMSGFCVVGARLAKPDTGLLSYAEMLDQGRCMHEATNSIPIIGDADTGYGNAMNVQRTVKGYAAAGFAGILIEDQVWPKSCGHVRNKRVVARDEAVSRIRAACDARDSISGSNGNSGIVIVARTDARQAVSFEEAMWRASAFADAGADIVFVDALTTSAEMRTLCVQVRGAHKMASMLEGGGKTPILSPQELEEIGFKLCAYPLSLLSVSITAMQSALEGLKQGKVPQPPTMPTFEGLQAVLGFPEYFEEEAKYAVASPLPASSSASASSSADNQGNNQGNNVSNSSPRGTPSASSPPSSSPQAQAQTPPPQQTPPPPQRATASIEPDAVIEPGDTRPRSSSSTTSSSSAPNSPNSAYFSDFMDRSGTVDLTRSSIDDEYKRGGTGTGTGAPQFVRIKISDVRTGSVKLDTRFPAGFLGGAAAIIPQVAGLDLEALIRGERGGSGGERAKRGPGEPAFSFDADSDRIEVYLE